MKRLVIFDLDGTLLNTIEDLGRAANHALEVNGFPTHSVASYPFFVGNGVRKLIERVLPEDINKETVIDKMLADFSFTHSMSPRHSVAFHVGAGAAVPYGNATVLPFEKRFYAGGANSVRGWGVRTLGPGSFDATNSVNSFIYQCGDIRLDINFEYRAKLFWVLELGAFIDAGNIWTIRDYESQPGGVFKFNEFYKQIALAYGIGLRLDFTYYLLRFDMGLKDHNPAQNQERWPLIHPNWSRDATLHFSVGYPF